MRHVILPNGDLKLLAGNVDRSTLAYELSESYSRAEMLISEAFHEILTFIPPENIGALTEAPILADDAEYCSDAFGYVVPPEANVWYFPDYAVRCPWEELSRKGYVVFQKAPQ